ncbi:MAG: hypothetical protein ABI183_02350 [Polyangiaceae bacterium]
MRLANALLLAISLTGCASVLGIKDSPETVIATPDSDATNLVVASGYALWIDGQDTQAYLYSARIDGGGPIVKQSVQFLRTLASDGTSVCGYTIEGIDCFDPPTAATKFTVNVGASGLFDTRVADLIVVNGLVIWSESDLNPDESTNSYFIRTASADGSSTTQNVVVQSTESGGATAPYVPTTIAADSNNVYWLNGDTLESTPVGGGSAPTSIAKNVSNCDVLAVDATNLYCGAPSTNLASAITVYPLAGGSTSTLISDQINSFATDGTFVYWTSSDGIKSNEPTGRLSKIPIGGGATVPLASGQDNPSSISVDATSLYWLIGGEAGIDAVLRAAK